MSRRRWGPVARFDPHACPPDSPAECPKGRSVLYLGDTFPTAVLEAFQDFKESGVGICPQWQGGWFVPGKPGVLTDLRRPQVRQIDQCPQDIGDGAYAREITQDWARAFYEDLQSEIGMGVLYPSRQARPLRGINRGIWDAFPGLKRFRSNSNEQEFPLQHPDIWPTVQSIIARSDVRWAWRILSDDCFRCHAAGAITATTP